MSLACATRCRVAIFESTSSRIGFAELTSNAAAATPNIHRPEIPTTSSAKYYRLFKDEAGVLQQQKRRGLAFFGEEAV
jgi:hypothetical protein